MKSNLVGPWAIYRRVQDAKLWTRFEVLCARQDRSKSEAVTEAVRQWVAATDPDGETDV